MGTQCFQISDPWDRYDNKLEEGFSVVLILNNRVIGGSIVSAGITDHHPVDNIKTFCYIVERSDLVCCNFLCNCALEACHEDYTVHVTAYDTFNNSAKDVSKALVPCVRRFVQK